MLWFRYYFIFLYEILFLFFKNLFLGNWICGGWWSFRIIIWILCFNIYWSLICSDWWSFGNLILSFNIWWSWNFSVFWSVRSNNLILSTLWFILILILIDWLIIICWFIDNWWYLWLWARFNIICLCVKNCRSLRWLFNIVILLFYFFICFLINDWWFPI